MARPRWSHNEWLSREQRIGEMPERFWKNGIFGIIGAFFSLRRVK